MTVSCLNVCSLRVPNIMSLKCKCKWLPDFIERLKASACISFIYRSYHLPMPDPSPSTLTVLNSNFLQLGRRSLGVCFKKFLTSLTLAHLLDKLTASKLALFSVTQCTSQKIMNFECHPMSRMHRHFICVCDFLLVFNSNYIAALLYRLSEILVNKSQFFVASPTKFCNSVLYGKLR